MKIILFANTDWYLYNFRLPLAKALRELSHEVVMISPSGEYVKKIEKEGFRWVHVSMNRRSVNPFSEIWVIRKLITIYQVEKPDLVHHFTIKPVVYGSIAAKLSGIKSIINAVAGLGFIFTNNGILARSLRPIIKLIFKFSLNGNRSRLILQNPDDQTFFMRSNLIDKDKITLIKGSGVSTDRFTPNPDKQYDNFNVLLASRLLWDKGIADYVESARIVKKEYPGTSFLLAGEPDSGNPGSVQESDLVCWQSEGVIQSLGHVDNMPERFKDINIVVLPTVYGEGVPRVLIEAAAAGIPLIATDVPGCREIVLHDKNGYLVEPNSPQQIAESIMKLISNVEQSKAMGKFGRQLVLDEFDEESVLKRTVEVYNETLI